VLACALALALPHAALAQARSPLGRGDVIDRLNSSSMRPLPPLAPPPAARPESVWVPDRYLSLPGVPGPVHVPAHWEHPVSPHEVYAPPLVGRTPDGSPVYFPAGVRPKADARQAP
jgi:hypothetical protein